MDMRKKIQFIIPPHAKKWVVEKEFKDERHYDNYVSYMVREKGYTLDETWNITN